MRKRDHAAPRRHRPTKSVLQRFRTLFLKLKYHYTRHSFTMIVFVLALIAGAPIHPAIRLEPHGLRFVIPHQIVRQASYNEIFERTGTRSLTRAVPIYFTLRAKRMVRHFPLELPNSMAFHRAHDILLAEYDPRQFDRLINNLPVMLSQSIRDVMILPYGLNKFSRSCCVMFFGKPLTYRFAPLIASLLGLAYDTCQDARSLIAFGFISIK